MGLLAEQIVIECPAAVLGALLQEPSTAWLTPFLRLAADNGEEVGLRVLGCSGGPVGEARGPDRFEAGRPRRTGAGLRLAVSWETSAYLTLGTVVDGVLAARPAADGDFTIVSVEGRYLPPPELEGSHTGVAAARRAAEAAIRTLLVQLRSAVEERSSHA